MKDTNICLRASQELKERLIELAYQEGRTQANYIEQLVNRDYKEKQAERKKLSKK